MRGVVNRQVGSVGSYQELWLRLWLEFHEVSGQQRGWVFPEFGFISSSLYFQIFLKIYFYFVCTSALPVCMCLDTTICMLDTHEGQKRVLDPLTLELLPTYGC